MSDLKPCPFCGGEARAEEYGDGYIPQCDHKHTCVIAECEFPADEWYISEGFAIEAWNARWERTCGIWRGSRGSVWGQEDDLELWCEHCDIVLEEDWNYCPECGAKVVEE